MYFGFIQVMQKKQRQNSKKKLTNKMLNAGIDPLWNVI